MSPAAVSWLWLLPAVPALGALLNATVGRASRKEAVVSAIAIGAVVIAFCFAIAVFLSGEVTQQLWTVLDTGAVHVDAALTADRLSGLLALVISGIGALIHIYSTAYMQGEAGHWRFFAALNLFVAAMLVLVLADNLVLMFVGWEGVGFCSWLLIGYWHEQLDKVRAANKAFIVNRIGDVGLVVGMLLLFWATEPHTFQFRALIAQLSGSPSATLTLACLMLFVGAAAKSAQLPLHGWLPDAMAGPTPVSALIHAATMVTAGVYLMVRLHPLIAQSALAMTVIAWVGAATALFAAICALVQTDLKRVLAYSTISQLGFMFLAVGVGAWWPAVFHLVTHAFFKAALFLSAGAVLHQTHHEQDLRRLGGLRAALPVVHWVYVVTALALAGVPLAGSFFSKDFILQGAWAASPVLWGVASLAALGTSLYAWRSYVLVFSGTWRGAREAPVTDAPAAMRWVLITLAVGAVATAGLALPGVFPEPDTGLSHLAEGALLGVATLSALAGILIARRIWANGPLPVRSPWTIAFVIGGLGFDRLYNRLTRIAIGVAYQLAAFDRIVVDGVVEAFATVIRYLCMFEAAFDFYVIDGMVHLVGQISMRTGKSLRGLQSGDLMRYLYVAVAGVLIVVCLQYWIR